MVGRNGRQPVAARLFACCPQAVPQEKLPLFARVESCSLVINAYFSQQYYMLFAICDQRMRLSIQLRSSSLDACKIAAAMANA